MFGSRKRKQLTLEEKVNEIRLTEKGESSRKLSSEFEVGKTQIKNIVKTKDAILSKWKNSETSDRKIVKARPYLYTDLNYTQIKMIWKKSPRQRKCH